MIVVDRDGGNVPIRDISLVCKLFITIVCEVISQRNSYDSLIQTNNIVAEWLSQLRWDILNYPKDEMLFRRCA